MSDGRSFTGPAKAGPFWLLVAGLAVYGALCLSAVARYSWLPNANLAHNASVAACLASGKGYTCDSLADYIYRPKSVRHAEDTLPLGLPTVMALFFAVLGRKAVVAYFPAVFFFIALGLMAYRVGKSRFGTAGGIVAAFLVWTDVNMTSISLYGLEDTAFAFFFLATLHYMPLGHEKAGSKKGFILSGLFAGLAFYMKFEGLILPIACIAAYLLFALRRDKGSVAGRLKGPAVFIAVFGLTLSPWALRNLYHFKTVLYPGALSRCALNVGRPGTLDHPGPFIPFQELYAADNMPSFGRLERERGLRYFLLSRPKHEAVRLGRLFTGYKIFGLGIMLFGIMGVFWAWTRGHKDWVILNATAMFFSALWVFAGPFRLPDFFVFIPPAAVLAAYFLVEFGKWVRDEASPRAGIAFGIVMILMFGTTNYFQWKDIFRHPPSPGFESRIEALNKWIETNVGDSETIITRMPRYVSWGASRQAIATPLAGWEGLMELARRYGAGYMIIEQGPAMALNVTQTGGKDFPPYEWIGLFEGNKINGASLAYESDEMFYVYRLPGVR